MAAWRTELIGRLATVGVVDAVPAPDPATTDTVIGRWQMVRRSMPVDPDPLLDSLVWLLDRYIQINDGLSPIRAWTALSAEVWPLGTAIPAVGVASATVPPAAPASSAPEPSPEPPAEKEA